MIKKRIAIVLSAFLAVAMATWFFLAREASRTTPIQSAEPAFAEKYRATSQIPSTEQARQVSKTSLPRSMAEEFENATDLRAFYDKYAVDLNRATPETRYFLQKALMQCFLVANKGIEGAKAIMVKTIPPNDPNKELRLAAKTKIEFDRCAGFQGRAITIDEIDEMGRLAIDGKCPLALAENLTRQLYTDEPGKADEAKEIAKKLLEQRNPYAFTQVAAFISTGQPIQKMGDETISKEVFAGAWSLAECHYGADCGPNNKTLLAVCAGFGQCGADSVEDFVKKFVIKSSDDYEKILKYRDYLIAAIDKQDWSKLGL